jgi:predicted TPR repeat methyltransferase
MLERCRACGLSELTPVLSLGSMPLANALLATTVAAESSYPLDLVFCPRCALLQITETVPPEQLFGDYAYLSSVSKTVVDNAQRIVERTVAARRLGSAHLAVEIASNDGYLLQHYRDRGVNVLGIEPAQNIAVLARQRGITTVNEFFDASLAARLRAEGVAADVLHANNVIAHVADLAGVLDGIRTLLQPDGVAIVEVPYVRDMIDHLEFDTIYHEHLCYFSLTSLHRAVSAHGLAVVDVERIPIHGGSLRVTIGHAESGEAAAPVSVLMAEEAALGLPGLRYYAGFGRRVERLRRELRSLVGLLKAGGHRIAAYGASAKGATLLNYCGIGAETLDFVVDRSPLKQGRFTPGTRLPICSPDRLLSDRPEFSLLLVWNIADEVFKEQHAYRALGGRFIVPIPSPAIV